jgi:microcystin-dependent protein
MSEPFLGEIRIFGLNFEPHGWAACNGRLLPINQYQALFSILGTTYGGDGRTTFALPNLQGRIPLGAGTGPGLTPRDLGASGGTEAVTLALNQLPSHNHAAKCNSANGNQYGPANHYWAQDAGGAKEYNASSTGQMSAGAIGPAGGGQPHSNLQPYRVVNYCIALTGIFPSRS